MNQLQVRFLAQLRSHLQSQQELLIEALFVDQAQEHKVEVVEVPGAITEAPTKTPLLLKNGKGNPALGLVIERFVQNTSEFKIGDLADHLKTSGYPGTSRATTKYHLDKLKRTGRLVYEGNRARGTYRLVAENGSSAIPERKELLGQSPVKNNSTPRRWRSSEIRQEVLKFALANGGKFSKPAFKHAYQTNFDNGELEGKHLDQAVSEMKVRYRLLDSTGVGEYKLTTVGRKEAERGVDSGGASPKPKRKEERRAELWNDILNFAAGSGGEFTTPAYFAVAPGRLNKTIVPGAIAGTIGQLVHSKKLQKIGDQRYKLVY